MTPQRLDTDLKSTGIHLLDNALGGGIPSGSIICCLINPKSMAEVLIYQFASIGKVLYFTTEREPKHILHDASQLNFDINNTSFVDVYSKFNHREFENKSPTSKKNIYEISYTNANNDAKLFIESVQMPKDTLWKFEFWTKDKVTKILSDLGNKIFTKLLKTKEDSSFYFSKVDTKNKRFTIELNNCPECSGLSGFKEGICYYHAGLFAGLFSHLLDSKMSAYETKCQAAGDKNCSFTLGPSDDPETQTNFNEFIENMPLQKYDNTVDEISQFTEFLLKQVQANENNRIIFDNFSFYIDFIENKEKIRHHLNHIYEITNRTNSLCYLFILKDTHKKELENIILNKCDVIFDFDVIVGNDNRITNLITISKVRGMIAPDKRIKFHIKDRIIIDTSDTII